MASKIAEIEGVDPRALPDSVLTSAEPLLLRGLVADWPLVHAARESSRAAEAYLRKFDRGVAVHVAVGARAMAGRFFYNADFTGLNFESQVQPLGAVLDELARGAGPEQRAHVYVGATSVDTCLPGFREHNDLGFGNRKPHANIWIGNRTRIAAHYDVPDNIACVAAGRRRFTLLSPEQIENLYVGPLDLTPAGQAISLVDFAHPDLGKHPKFAIAREHALIGELGPGDALFVPSLWWHHVESLEDFNVLVNYWWRRSPPYMVSPANALMLAILSVRDLPPEQRRAWQNLFQHYVFDAGENTVAHIPPAARGVLGTLDAGLMREMRVRLLARLGR